MKKGRESMNKLRNQKLGTITLMGLWLLTGCTTESHYTHNHEPNEQRETTENAETTTETANLLAAQTATEAASEQSIEAEDTNLQPSDEIRGRVMEITDHTIEIREQISITVGEEDLVSEAPEEDGWLTITFNEETVFEVIEFNAGGILNRSYGTEADIYLDDGLQAFGQQHEDEFAATKIEIWVLIQ